MNWLQRLRRWLPGRKRTEVRAAAAAEKAKPEEQRILEARLGYAFRDSSLLEEALTHVSAKGANPDIATLERLEFLGDAVLGSILAETLFARFPAAPEGELTRMRSYLASGKALSQLARRLELSDHLRMSSSERRAGGANRAGVLEDALEALIGAVFCDSNYARTREVVFAWYGEALAELSVDEAAPANPKGRLQEELQARHGNVTPVYEILEESGPAHRRWFRAVVKFQDKSLAEGEGHSKKAAEEGAAKNALESLDELISESAAAGQPYPEEEATNQPSSRDL